MIFGILFLTLSAIVGKLLTDVTLWGSLWGNHFCILVVRLNVVFSFRITQKKWQTKGSQHEELLRVTWTVWIKHPQIVLMYNTNILVHWRQITWGQPPAGTKPCVSIHDTKIFISSIVKDGWHHRNKCFCFVLSWHRLWAMLTHWRLFELLHTLR